MKLKTIAALGTTGAILCAGLQEGWTDALEEGSATLESAHAPQTPTSPEPLNVQDQKIKELLEKITAEDLYPGDPCLSENRAWIKNLGTDQDTPALLALQACANAHPESSKAIDVNTALLTERATYEKHCGGEQAESCRKAQEAMRTALQKLGLPGDWHYEVDFTPSYDADGNPIGHAAEPGYQAYLDNPKQNHKDLFSLQAYPSGEGFVYAYTVACGMEDNLSVGTPSFPKDMDATLQEMKAVLDHHPIGD